MSAERSGSPALRLGGLALIAAGVAVIFLGEFEVLPRSVLTSAIGAAIAVVGFVVHVRGRLDGA